MFRPLACFIGLRYARSRRRRGVVSFITGASLLGITLGVAALIVILSVMNGLDTEARVRLLSLSAHASLSARGTTGIPDWEETAIELESIPGVTGVSPNVQIEGMLAVGPRMYPAVVQGVLPEREQRTSEIAKLVEFGSFESLESDQRTILIGQALAVNLGAAVGDTVNLLYARTVNGVPRPSLVPFVVGGVFSAGIAQHDANLAFIQLQAGSQIRKLGGNPAGLSIRVTEPLAIAGIADAIRAAGTAAGLNYSDWTEQHRSHFRAIQIEKMMMSIILMLIVAVAAFNIVASLMMVVTDKKKDIAILRTCGMQPANVSRIFLFQGSIIGAGGTILGAVLGLILALNVENIVPWLETTFNFKIMPGDVYYVTQIPSEIHVQDVVLICVFAFIVAVIATLYPSRRAASIAPADALRYD